MFNRFVRALLILVFVPMVVLLIYVTIKNGEAGFSKGWTMVVAQVTNFVNLVADAPKAVVTNLQFWQTVGTALVVAMFFKKH